MQGCFPYIILHDSNVRSELQVCRIHVISDRWISSKQMKWLELRLVFGSCSYFMVCLDILLDVVNCDRWIPAEILEGGYNDS